MAFPFLGSKFALLFKPDLYERKYYSCRTGTGEKPVRNFAELGFLAAVAPG